MSALARGLNALGLLAIVGVLLVLFWYQLARGQLPCSLCHLQRTGFIAAGIGLLLNVRFGSSESHYGIAILGALAGAAAAGRQILLHAAPASPGGPVLFGMHLDTWVFVAFCLILVFCGAMLFVESQFVEGVHDVRPDSLAQVLAWLFLLVALGNAVSTLLVCGVGSCPENPTAYQLPWRR